MANRKRIRAESNTEGFQRTRDDLLATLQSGSSLKAARARKEFASLSEAEFIECVQWAWDAATIGSRDKDTETQIAAARLNLMYRTALDGGDVFTALQTQKEINRLVGIHNTILRGTGDAGKLARLKQKQALRR